MTRTVHGACPHDCPDTCAMLVSVDGRAGGGSAGQPRPARDRRVPVREGVQLPRPRLRERSHPPPAGPFSAKGAGEFRRASWDEALERVAEGLRAASTSTAAIRSALQLHGHPWSASGRLDGRPRYECPRRERRSCAPSAPPPALSVWWPRTACRRRSIPRSGPRALPSRLGLEPDVDGSAPVAEVHAGAGKRRAAVVVDPYRSRTARVADEHLRPLPGTDGALALGMMRAVVDAGLADEEWCRAHADGYDELLARLGEHPVQRWARSAGSGPTTSRGSRASSRPRSRRCCGSASAPSATRRADRIPHDRLPACAGGCLAPPRRRLLLHPDGDRERGASAVIEGADLRPGRCARSTCRSSARR